MTEKTYAQITREIQALQAHAEKLRAGELQAVITKLNETIAKHGLKAEDLRFAGAEPTSGAPARSSRQAASSSPRSASSSTGAKYGDGQGNSWGGRGPRPAWLRDALSKGRTLESFAVSGKSEPSEPAPAAPGRASGNGEANENSGAKSPLPPLYSHPKTGQTWSGRGPKPAWLKQGLKKRGASLSDFLISARESGQTAPEAAAPATSASPASSKTSKTAKSAAVPQGAGSTKKSLAEKISSHAKGSSGTTTKPDAAPAPASATPGTAAKKTAGKTTGKQSSEAGTAPTPAKAAVKTAAKKSTTSTASKPAETPPHAASAAPAKKAASKNPAKTAGKSPKQPSAKKGPANKRITSSMAPPAETPPASPPAAPLPAQEPVPAEGQEPTPGT